LLLAARCLLMVAGCWSTFLRSAICKNNKERKEQRDKIHMNYVNQTAL